jgi:DNA (cytosine-5)-methyltransferase 1
VVDVGGVLVKPRLLDLFCGAGGCSVGYARAGFDVVGVDIEPHPDYPYEMWLRSWERSEHWWGLFDVIHASPPCPRYSVATRAENRDKHPDLVGPVRDALRDWGGVYVIENVPGAPLDNPMMICGRAMGLEAIARHRLFESNAPLMSPGCACDGQGSVSVFGHSGEDRRKSTRERLGGAYGQHLGIAEVKKLMGVEWMTRRDDVSDAIPPAYTEFIGEQIMAHLAVAA